MSARREKLRDRLAYQLADAIETGEIEVEDAIAIAKSVMCIMISLMPGDVRRAVARKIAETIGADTERLNQGREPLRRSFH